MADSELRRDAASITRSTKSGTATGRTLVEEGAGLAFGLPGKVVAKLSLTLLEHAVTAGLDRRKQKCMERVEELFAPIACTEDGEPELSEDDLLKLIREDPAKALDSILNAAINDDESKNVNVYGRFYRGLLRKRTRSSAGKRSFKAVKALVGSDLHSQGLRGQECQGLCADREGRWRQVGPPKVRKQPSHRDTDRGPRARAPRPLQRSARKQAAVSGRGACDRPVPCFVTAADRGIA